MSKVPNSKQKRNGGIKDITFLYQWYMYEMENKIINKTKAEMQWEVSKEAEKEFRNAISNRYGKEELDELFKLIRGAEYRRAKEDFRKDVLKKMDEEIRVLERIDGEIEAKFKLLNADNSNQHMRIKASLTVLNDLKVEVEKLK